jgi:P4 family phage/plasmid primase-like protien
VRVTVLAIALDYIQLGWSPVPVLFKDKGPRFKGWQTLRVNERDAAEYFDGAAQNIGVLLGPPSNGLTDVDLDCPEALALADGFLPRTEARFGRCSKPRSHWLYRTTLGEAEERAVLTFKDPETGAMLVEIRIGGSTAAQTVFPGSVHPSGEAIEWTDFGRKPRDIDGETLKQSVSVLAALSLFIRHWPAQGSRHEAALVLGGFFARCGGRFASREADLVELIAQEAGDEELRDRRRAAEAAAVEYERGGRACGLPRLKELFGDKVAAAAAEWLGYLADANPGISEDALALSFANLHESRLRYVANWGRWLDYDGTRWMREETLLAFDLARDVCREEAAKAKSPKLADAIKSGKTVNAVQRFAQADRRLAATTEQWDADPWLLNTPQGVADLKTGSLRAHSRLDYITKITAVSPGGNCPLWRDHLRRIMDEDEELIAYLQRVFGYGLTGITREHALFFAYGTGANGKSVTINTVLGIMNEYQRTASMETFTLSKFDRHPTELAGLQGARLVSASETEEGRPWAEARIKALTGGDKIEARFMRQDFFEYTPQFKLFISGNHKPRLRSVDEATSRRFQVIPFTVTIPPEQRDKGLEEKLKSEWPGILAWMIEGCLLWQRDGLNPPEAVLNSTSSYFNDEDTVLRWFEECCEADPSARTPSLEAYNSFGNWATRTREFVLSQKAFSERLAARAERLGLTKGADRKGAYFQGLRLREEVFVPF